jgi:hypothetical protein
MSHAKGDSITDLVGATRGNRPNVCTLQFGELSFSEGRPTDRTFFLVSKEHSTLKGSVPELLCDEACDYGMLYWPRLTRVVCRRLECPSIVYERRGRRVLAWKQFELPDAAALGRPKHFVVVVHENLAEIPNPSRTVLGLDEVVDLDALVEVIGKNLVETLQLLIALHPLADVMHSFPFVDIAVGILRFVVEEEHMVAKRAASGLEHAAV